MSKGDEIIFYMGMWIVSFILTIWLGTSPAVHEFIEKIRKRL